MTDGVGKLITAEQRARDGRLAWLIVLCGAALSLTILVLAFSALRRVAVGWAEQSMREAREDMMRRQTMPSPAPPTVSLLPTLPAEPVGDVGRWIGPDDYPGGALRRGEEGRVRVLVTVDDGGEATGCSVLQSSGSYSLDNGTCTAMMRNGRWTTVAPGRYGIRRWTSPAIRWQLPD